MNATQAENLRILIRHMENNVKRTLCMSDVQTPCGSPACAIGEATRIPVFGLSLPRLPDGHMPILRSNVIHNGVLCCYRVAAEEVFGTTYLFGLTIRGAADSGNPTPQEWAAEAREVLRENGYSMEPDNPPVMDAFARFKSRVLEPVEL